MKRKILAMLLVLALMMNGNLAIDVAAAGTDRTTNGISMRQKTSISLGRNHSAAIAGNGDLYLWGDNDHGQIGNGITTDQRSPEKVLEDVVSVSLGDYHSAAITKDRDLYLWGYNGYGQIGNGTRNDQMTPEKVLEDVVSVSLGAYRSAAITENGDLYLWGDNYYGQIGNGQAGNNLNDDQTIPEKVLEDVVSVSLGSDHSAAITENGDLYLWGNNNCGQIGNGTTNHQMNPEKILEDVVSVSLYSWHSAAITENGDLYLWGYNHFGQIGNRTSKDQTTPEKVLEDVVSVSLGEGYSAAITKNRDLYLWGYNVCGQIGNGTTADYQPIPEKVLEDVVSVSLGEGYSAAITENGDLYLWGDNRYGQIGNGTTTDQYTPKKILEDVVSVSLHSWHSAAITENGDLYCWGANDYGQVGNGTTTNQDTPAKILENIKIYDKLYKVVGTLNSAGLGAGIKIDGTTYEVTDSDVVADANDILNEYGNTLVIATIQNNTITKISAVMKQIEPKVEIKPDISGLLYSGGKFDKTKFKLNVRLYWDTKKSYVGLSEYQMSDFEGHLDKLSDQAVTIDNLNIAQVYEKDDMKQENPFVEFQNGLFSSNIRYDKDINLTLKPGEEKTYEIDVKVKEDIKLKKISNQFDFNASAKLSDTNDYLRDTYTLNVTNCISASSSSGGVVSKDSDVKACADLLNSTQWTYDETPLWEVFGKNSNELQAIEYEINNYILSMHAMVDMSIGSDNTFAKKLKEHGIDGTKLASAVLGKLGITKPFLSQYKELSDYYTKAKEVKGTVTFHAIGTQGAYEGKDVIITFQIKTGYYGFGSESSAYGGFGTIDYTVKVDEKGVQKPKKTSKTGVITYANYDEFAGHLQKVAEKQIKTLYNIPGKEFDKICDAFCDSTFYKVATQTFGSGSNAIYATVKNVATDNESAIKGDIKDFTINLAKSKLQKTTKHSVHCPVNVYVDDSEGNEIASIVDNQVTNSSEDIDLYVVGDDKYIILPSDELYSIRYEGNDTGTMNYEVTEYINSEEQYRYEYKEIPLSNTLRYSNISFDSLGNGRLYDLLKEDEEYIQPDTIIVNEDSEYYSAAIPAESIQISDGQSEEEQSSIQLAPEEEKKLYAEIEPYNASYTNVTWESSDESVVSVDEIGNVTAIKEGSTTITASLNSGSDTGVLSDTIEITVTSDTEPSEQPQATPAPTPTDNPSQKPQGGSTQKPTGEPETTLPPEVMNTPIPNSSLDSTYSDQADLSEEDSGNNETSKKKAGKPKINLKKNKKYSGKTKVVVRAPGKLKLIKINNKKLRKLRYKGKKKFTFKLKKVRSMLKYGKKNTIVIWDKNGKKCKVRFRMAKK